MRTYRFLKFASLPKILQSFNTWYQWIFYFTSYDKIWPVMCVSKFLYIQTLSTIEWLEKKHYVEVASLSNIISILFRIHSTDME